MSAEFANLAELEPLSQVRRAEEEPHIKVSRVENKMKRATLVIGVLWASTFASTAIAQTDWIAKKRPRLMCSTLPYVFDCEIPLAASDPQFSSRCFYVAQGQSTLMRSDHRMGFSNDIVSLQLDAGIKVTGVVTEKQTGDQSECSQVDK